jgi:hypothetical protein
MSTDQKLTPELHRKQVEAYVRELPAYETYKAVLQGDLDSLLASYTTNARKAEVQKEIDIQSLVLANETDAGKKMRLTLTLARLLAAKGDHAEAVKGLRPYQTVEGPLQCELLACLGHCLCAANRDNPESRAYSDGVRVLDQALTQCKAPGLAFVPNPRTRNSLHARVLQRLGRALEKVKTRRCGLAPATRRPTRSSRRTPITSPTCWATKYSARTS